MRIKKYLRNIVFITLSFVLYLAWNNGGEKIYAKAVSFGIEKVTSRFSSIEKSSIKHFENQNKTLIYCYYPDRTTNIAVEFCLPIVLLLAWHIALFFDSRLKAKTALKMMSINIFIIYFLQILFPLLLFNISQSKVKSTGLFIGLQIFIFLVLFLIIKDSLIIKYKYSSINKK
jgi:hypothetical protein